MMLEGFGPRAKAWLGARALEVGTEVRKAGIEVLAKALRHCAGLP